MESNNKRFSLRKDWKLVNFCEFDKYATKSYCAIHGVYENLNLGDITKVDETKLENFNMICGGSPCQDFSVAGKQKGSVWTCKDCGHEYNPLTVHWSQRNKCPHCDSEYIEKTRSSLLVEYLRVIRANKPNFGMYENVKNIVGKQFRDTTFKLFEDELHEYGYNTYWKVLNAKDYGIPQNRERVYLIFIKKDLDNGKFVFPEGFDNGIRLKDVLEDEVDEKYYISDDKVQRFLENLKTENICENSTLKLDGNNYNQRCVVHTPDDFCRTIIGSGGSGGYHAGNEPKVLVESKNNSDICDNENSPRFIGNINRPDFGTGYAGGVWDTEHISPTLTTMQGGGRQPHIVCGIDKSVNDTKQIEYANCITAREDRGISNRKSEGTAVLEKVGNVNPSGKGMNGNVFSEDGLAPTLTTNKGEGNKILTGIRIRKLTPKECFRLMGFSDSAYEAASKVVSNSQLYKQSGNSIVVDVLYYILVELYKAIPYLFDDLKLSSFFSGIGAFEIALDRLYESINTGNFIDPYSYFHNCNQEENTNQVYNPLKDKTQYGWHFEQEVYLPKGIARALKAGGGSGNIPKVILNDLNNNDNYYYTVEDGKENCIERFNNYESAYDFFCKNDMAQELFVFTKKTDELIGCLYSKGNFTKPQAE